MICAVWTNSAPEAFSFFTELASCFGIDCQVRPPGDIDGACGIISDNSCEGLDLGEFHIPFLKCAGNSKEENFKTERRRISFSAEKSVAWPFHAQSFKAPFPITDTHGNWPPQSKTVACAGEYPFWAVEGNAPTRKHFTTLNLPRLGKGEMLCDRCKGEQFVSALPFLYFCRDMMEFAGWQAPETRACFMFDDPNLHWPTYGCVNFREIAKSAVNNHYHASFAMVPLDCWWEHRGAVRVFHENKDALSLLVHGNDHTRCELAQPRSANECMELLGTATTRIERFEKRTRLQVARIMAAPHGACSETMLQQMAKSGFEGACISPWSLRDHNPEAIWTSRIGIATSEWISGFPVLPRFRLAKGCENQAAIAALLGQPIVAVGHHNDLADGLGGLESVAAEINAFGRVHWTRIDAIARSNVWIKQTGHTQYIRPFSSLLPVQLRPETTRVKIEEIGISHGFQMSGKGNSRVANGNEWEVQPGTKEIMLTAMSSSLEAAPRLPLRTPFAAVARRFAAECRDRVFPVVTQLGLRRRKGI